MINQKSRISARHIALLFSFAIFSMPFRAFSIEIDWEIQNRFRLLKNSKDAEEKLYRLAMISDAIKGGLNKTTPADKTTIKQITDVAPDGYFGFDHMPSTHYNRLNRTYDPAYTKAPSIWKIELHAAGVSKNSKCSWFRNGKPLKGIGDCKNFIPDTSFGKNAELELYVDGSFVGTKTIDPSDTLVVALGDSYISGEGSPDVPSKGWFWPFKGDAEWLDKKCHVSLLAWPTLVAARLAADNPHKSVTFVTRACSGAEASHLFKPCAPSIKRHGPDGNPSEVECYRGPEENVSAHNDGTDRDYLEPQIKQLRGDLCLGSISKDGDCLGEFRQPDLVLLSAGGNDAGFGSTIINAVKDRIDNNDDDTEKEKGIRNKYKSKNREGLKSLWNYFPEMADALLDTSSGFSKAHFVYAIYPDPLMRDGNESSFCGVRKDGDGEKFLGLLSGVGPVRYFADRIGKRETSQEMADIRDDFVKWLTGSVASKTEKIKEWEYLGLRGMNIGIQCALAKNKRPFPVGENLREYAWKTNDCERFWGLNGFNQFVPNGTWNFVLLRNEYESGKQLLGYVTNGYCKAEDDVTGRWFRVMGDALKVSDYHGTLHPNIYGQLYYSNRVLPAVRSALGLDSATP